MKVINEYNDAVKMYAEEFADQIDREADDAGLLVDAWEHAHKEHIRTKPAVGNPSDEWVKENEKIERNLNASKKKFDKICESWRDGEENPNAIKYAKQRIAEELPKLQGQYQEITDAILPDPIKVYQNTLGAYQDIFLQKTQENLLAQQQLVEAWTTCLKSCCENGPSIFDDIVSLGKASKEWEAESERLRGQALHHHTQALGSWNIINIGPSHPDVVKFAEESVKKHHPDIEQNYQDKIARIKETEQAERQKELKERMAEIETPKRDSQTAVLSR